jgi:polygalacturonase
MGPGTIDARGDLVSGTPRLINSKNAQNLTVYNLTLKHAGKEHLYVEGGRNFTAWGVTIATPANTHNTDGIDIDSRTNATIIHAMVGLDNSNVTPEGPDVTIFSFMLFER